MQVCRLANVLSDAGVTSGDVVALYMPVSPLAVATMLATSRLGAIHNVVFAGFSAEALAARVRDAGARVIVTADEAVSFFAILSIYKKQKEVARDSRFAFFNQS